MWLIHPPFLENVSTIRKFSVSLLLPQFRRGVWQSDETLGVLGEIKENSVGNSILFQSVSLEYFCRCLYLLQYFTIKFADFGLNWLQVRGGCMSIPCASYKSFRGYKVLKRFVQHVYLFIYLSTWLLFGDNLSSFSWHIVTHSKKHEWDVFIGLVSFHSGTVDEEQWIFFLRKKNWCF